MTTECGLRHRRKYAAETQSSLFVIIHTMILWYLLVVFNSAVPYYHSVYLPAIRFQTPFVRFVNHSETSISSPLRFNEFHLRIDTTYSYVGKYASNREGVLIKIEFDIRYHQRSSPSLLLTRVSSFMFMRLTTVLRNFDISMKLDPLHTMSKLSIPPYSTVLFSLSLDQYCCCYQL